MQPNISTISSKLEPVQHVSEPSHSHNTEIMLCKLDDRQTTSFGVRKVLSLPRPFHSEAHCVLEFLWGFAGFTYVCYDMG